MPPKSVVKSARGAKHPLFAPLDFSDRRFKIELGTQIFFWRNLCNFVVQIQNFSATPLRPPTFSATSNSKICDFGPKMAIFGLSCACRVPKCSQIDENFFAKPFGVLGSGTKKKIGHPAPATHIFGHRNFYI